MASSNHTNSDGNGSDQRRAPPDRAAVDTEAAAKQDQVHADAQALRESARRVEASLPAHGEAATDPRAAAMQDQIKADHDLLQESARRVEQSVSAEVRDTPVQPMNHPARASDDNSQAIRNVDAAHENAEAAREGARRVNESLAHGTDRDRR